MMNRDIGKKWLVGILATFLVIFAFGQILIQWFVDPSIERIMKEAIRSRSDGLYKIDSLDVEWRLATRSLSIENFSISYDSLRAEELTQAGKPPANIISFFVPRIEISGFEMRNALTKRRLNLEAITIYEPQFNWVNRFPKQNKEPIKIENLYTYIHKWTDALTIEKLQLENGTFQFNNQREFSENAFIAKGISIDIAEFRIDSTTVPGIDRPFYADEINIEVDVDDYSYVLPDSSYVINVGKLGVSSSRGEIFAEDFQIRPNYRLFTKGQRRKQNIFEGEIPRLQIGGVQFHKAYFEDSLKIGSLRLIDPNLVQVGKVAVESETKKSFDPAELYNVISEQISAIHIEGVSIERGTYRKIRSILDPTTLVELKGIGAYFQNVRLDTSLLLPDKRLFFSEELDVKTDQYFFQLSDGDYTLNGGRMGISTLDSRLFASGIHLDPAPSKYAEARKRGTDVVGVYLPNLAIDGLNLSQSWYDRILDVSRFHISQPKVTLTNFPEVEKKRVDSLAQSNLYLAVSDYLKSFTIRDFQIEEGKFQFNTNNQLSENVFAAQDIDVSIHNFQLNESARNKTDNPFYADEIDIDMNVEEYSYLFPDSSYTLTAGSIGISTADSAISIDSLYLIPHVTHFRNDDSKADQMAEIFVPHFQIAGIDVYRAYFQKELTIAKINFKKPRIKLSTYTPTIQPSSKEPFSIDKIDPYQLIKGQFKFLKINDIHIDSAYVENVNHRKDSIEKWNFPQVDLKIESFYLDSLQKMDDSNFMFAEDVILGIDSFVYPLSDQIHQIEISNFQLSTQDRSIKIYDSRLSPLSTQSRNKLSSNTWKVDFPYIFLDGINPYELLADKKIMLEQVLINDPVVALTSSANPSPKSKKNREAFDLYQLVADQLEAVHVKKFMVMDGNIAYNEQNTNASNTFSATDVTVLISNFQLDSIAQSKTDNPFYADNISIGINVEDYSFLLPDSTYEVRVGNIGLSTLDSAIYAEGIRLVPNWEFSKIQSSRQITEVEIPRARLSGINAQEIYLDRKLDLGKLEIFQPNIRLYTRPDKPISSKPPTANLHKALAKDWEILKIKEISIKDGGIRQIFPQRKRRGAINVPNFDVSLKGFEFDSLSFLRPNRLMYADESEFILRGYSLPVLDSIFTLQSPTLRVLPNQSLVIADSVQLIPNYGLYDFFLEKGYIMDNIQVGTRRVRLEEVNIFEILENQRMHLPRVYVGGLDLQVKKDRGFTQKPNKRPPLPQELLKKIDNYLRVDSLWITNGRIDFQEQTDNMERPGKFNLSEINALLTNFTNDPTRIQAGVEAQLDATARVLGEGALTAQFYYPLGDSINSYRFNGVIGPMDMTRLNDVLESAALIRINSGKLSKATFEVDANQYHSKGRMKMYYDDLKVSVIDVKGKEVEEISRKGLLSALANSLVVRTRNPNNRFLRVGKIDYKIERDKGFIAHWVQAILGGVKSSIGLKSKDEKDKSLGWNFLKKQRKKEENSPK